MKRILTDFHVEKLLLDSAHDAMPYYQYCKHNGIIPFIDLNEKRRIKEKYKDDFTIGKDSANYVQTECQFRYCGTAIPFLTVRSTAR